MVVFFPSLLPFFCESSLVIYFHDTYIYVSLVISITNCEFHQTWFDLQIAFWMIGSHWGKTIQCFQAFITFKQFFLFCPCELITLNLHWNFSNDLNIISFGQVLILNLIFWNCNFSKVLTFQVQIQFEIFRVFSPNSHTSPTLCKTISLSS